MWFCVWKMWWSSGPRELAVFCVLFGENKSLFPATQLMFEVNEGHEEFLPENVLVREDVQVERTPMFSFSLF